MQRQPAPLKPTELHLLLCLSRGEQHGYGLVAVLEEESCGAIKLEPGNLYRVIRRLLDDGFVAESERRPAGDSIGAQRRRYYRLTALGRRALAGELRRLQAVLTSTSARSVLRGGSGA